MRVSRAPSPRSRARACARGKPRRRSACAFRSRFVSVSFRFPEPVSGPSAAWDRRRVVFCVRPFRRLFFFFFAASFVFASPGSKNAFSASEGEASGSTGLVPLPLPPAMCASEGTRDARGDAAGDDSGEDASEGGCEEESDAGVFSSGTSPFPFSGTCSGRRGVLFLFASLTFVRARSSSSSSEPDEDANDGGADESFSSSSFRIDLLSGSSSSSSDGASDGGPDESSSSSAATFGFSSTSIAAESRS
mmetsp:Transcript_4682/g.19936  ORF Transcript_4682/g.19936 Transcript_4682/m.19936 type:complete len:248 (+) Transcript_4682:2811-3554(+)